MRSAFLVLFLLSAWCGIGQPQARIKIDTDRKIGTVDKLLYGNFTEHLGRCIYGGIYEPASPQANADGFRKDVMEATRDLGVSIVRWPGGNFVSGYHWEDGIGPRDKRPKRKDLAWGDVETNEVGTDEWLKFSRAIGAEPYICVNLGTGSLMKHAIGWNTVTQKQDSTIPTSAQRMVTRNHTV